MKFIPLDIGTFLVTSRSRPGDWHIVSLLPDEYYGCSCEDYAKGESFNTCRHVREAERRRRLGRLAMVVATRVTKRKVKEVWLT